MSALQPKKRDNSQLHLALEESARFVPLASGSKANAYILQTPAYCLLIDCGLGPRQLNQRLSDLHLSIAQIDAVLLSHAHSDHIRGLAALLAKKSLPVYASSETLKRLRHLPGPGRFFEVLKQGEKLAGIEITYGATSHDMPGGNWFILSWQDERLLFLTDTGKTDVAMREAATMLTGAVIEFNHDADMLAHGSYPRALKQRIASDKGHLSNDQALRFLASLPLEKLRFIYAAHLSEENNDPQLVSELIVKLMERSDIPGVEITIAGQNQTSAAQRLASIY
jgi:phosphoribosyl 1,2-cyclic phosphodiesterase